MYFLIHSFAQYFPYIYAFVCRVLLLSLLLLSRLVTEIIINLCTHSIHLINNQIKKTFVHRSMHSIFFKFHFFFSSFSSPYFDFNSIASLNYSHRLMLIISSFPLYIQFMLADFFVCIFFLICSLALSLTLRHPSTDLVLIIFKDILVCWFSSNKNERIKIKLVGNMWFHSYVARSLGQI